jgi:probable H4MPT-linked C1 transfer pathway protein
MASSQGSGQAVIGWDIGGAHLKAVRVEHGRVVAVALEPCPLWQGLDRLDVAFTAIEARIGCAYDNAVTMTGELTDLFTSRRDGVSAITAAAVQRLTRPMIYAGADGFIAPADAASHADAAASANWHATAALVAAHLPDALLVDIGSTTTDIIPVVSGRVAAAGSTDAGRLDAGELVYTGATRTPLMAVASAAPIGGRWTSVMAEYFATMADVNRILGRIGPDDDQHPAADGREKTLSASRLRLSRMVGRDVADLDEAAWTALAGWFAEAQLRRVHDAALLALSRVGLAAGAPVVACGIGAVAIDELARRLDRPVVSLSELIPVAPGASAGLAPAASVCAPATAIALLHMGRT